MWLTRRGTFQAEGTARAKTLSRGGLTKHDWSRRMEEEDRE